MRIVLRIIFVALIFCISFISIIGSGNIVSRAPDLYTYELTKTQELNNIGLDISERDMSSFISDFMLGKERSFTYTAYYQGKDQNLFSIYEGIIMEHVRNFFNRTLIWLGITILLSIAGIILFRYYDLKRELRSIYKWSWGIFAVFWVGVGVVISLPSWGVWYSRWFTEDFFGSDSLLLRLITPEFITHWLLAVMGVSIILMTLIGYIIWKLSKPKMMFW